MVFPKFQAATFSLAISLVFTMNARAEPCDDKPVKVVNPEIRAGEISGFCATYDQYKPNKSSEGEGSICKNNLRNLQLVFESAGADRKNVCESVTKAEAKKSCTEKDCQLESAKLHKAAAAQVDKVIGNLHQINSNILRKIKNDSDKVLAHVVNDLEVAKKHLTSPLAARSQLAPNRTDASDLKTIAANYPGKRVKSFSDIIDIHAKEDPNNLRNLAKFAAGGQIAPKNVFASLGQDKVKSGIAVGHLAVIAYAATMGKGIEQEITYNKDLKKKLEDLAHLAEENAAKTGQEGAPKKDPDGSSPAPDEDEDGISKLGKNPNTKKDTNGPPKGGDGSEPPPGSTAGSGAPPPDGAGPDKDGSKISQAPLGGSDLGKIIGALGGLAGLMKQGEGGNQPPPPRAQARPPEEGLYKMPGTENSSAPSKPVAETGGGGTKNTPEGYSFSDRGNKSESRIREGNSLPMNPGFVARVSTVSTSGGGGGEGSTGAPADSTHGQKGDQKKSETEKTAEAAPDESGGGSGGGASSSAGESSSGGGSGSGESIDDIVNDLENKIDDKEASGDASLLADSSSDADANGEDLNKVTSNEGPIEMGKMALGEISSAKQNSLDKNTSLFQRVHTTCYRAMKQGRVIHGVPNLHMKYPMSLGR